jgi:hypothetical protein
VANEQGKRLIRQKIEVSVIPRFGYNILAVFYQVEKFSRE